jgi:diadenosine tetraphosphate (Ap4A) HIT family hydrolase
MTIDKAGTDTGRDHQAEPPTAMPRPGGSTGFVLHERLAADTLDVGRLRLCRILLMNDATYPWLILVPERPSVQEIFELDAADRAALIEEVTLVSRALDALFEPDKLNVAAIGNIVAQLHVHIVARFRSDPVWPAPVWGRTPPYPYTVGAAGEMRQQLRARLADVLTAPA